MSLVALCKIMGEVPPTPLLFVPFFPNDLAEGGGVSSAKT